MAAQIAAHTGRVESATTLVESSATLVESAPALEVEGVLWDLDATLLDTESLLDEAARVALSTLSPQASLACQDENLVESALGASRGGTDTGPGSWPSIVLARLGVTDADEEKLRRSTYANFDRTIHLARLMPGAQAALDGIRASFPGIPQAIVTSSTRASLEAKVALFPGIFKDMSVTVAFDDVAPLHAKPHPLPYLAAAAMLGVDARRCVAVEDSVPGITAAAKSGAYVVAVPLQRHRATARALLGLGGEEEGQGGAGARAAVAAVGRGCVLSSLEEWDLSSIRYVAPPPGGGSIAPLSPLPLPEVTAAHIAKSGRLEAALRASSLWETAGAGGPAAGGAGAMPA